MLKKWMLIFPVVIVGVMAFGLIGTGAWFTDTATVADNTVTASTLNLKINGQEDAVQTYSLSNLSPGAWDLAGQAILKNDGTIKGKLWLEIVNVRNFENGCGNPETKAGDQTCGTGPDQGELGDLVKASFQANIDPWTRYGGEKVINASIGQRVDVIELAPGQSYPLVLYIVWTSTASDNLAQSDSVVFDVVFHLDQVH